MSAPASPRIFARSSARRGAEGARSMRIGGALAGLTLSAAAQAAPIVLVAEPGDPASVRAGMEAFRRASAGATADPPALRDADKTRDRARAEERSARGARAGAVHAQEPVDPSLFAPFSAARLFVPLDRYVAGALVTIPGTTTVLAALARLRPLLPEVELLSAPALLLLDEALDEPLRGRPLQVRKGAFPFV